MTLGNLHIFYVVWSMPFGKLMVKTLIIEMAYRINLDMFKFNYQMCYKCRFMQFTSSATRNSFVSTQTCSIIPRTFSKSLEWVALSTWNISRNIIMEATLQLIHLELSLLVQILTIPLLMIEREFLFRIFTCKLIIMQSFMFCKFHYIFV